MAQPQRSDMDFGSASRITNLPDGVAAQEPATVAQLAAAVEGLAWKDSARVASSTNITVASPGANINAIAMVAGDRVLLRGQTAPAENGLYIWNGAATPMTRALDMNTAAEVEQAVVTVEEGTDAGATFRQTAVNVTLGTTALAWTSFGTAAPAASETTAGISEVATQAETDAGVVDIAFVTPLKLTTWAGRVRKFSASFGDGAANSYVITHNLNTLDVQIYVYETGGSKRQVLCEVQHTGVNSVTLVFSALVATNALRCVVLG